MTMEERAREWDRKHTGHVTAVTDYSFEYVETEFDKKEQSFKEKKKYTVMKCYFFPNQKAFVIFDKFFVIIFIQS